MDIHNTPTVKDYEDYENWLRENECVFHPELIIKHTAEHGWGAFCSKQTIHKKEILFPTPRSIILYPQSEYLVSAQPVPSKKRPKLEVPQGNQWQNLIATILKEIAAGNDSHWRPYFNILPESLNTLVFWSEDELAFLRGTDLWKIGQDDRRTIQAGWKEFCQDAKKCDGIPKKLLSYESYRKVGSWVRAYSFTHPLWGVSMIPMADLLNHRTGFNNARLFLDSEDDSGSVMRAIQTIKPHNEIYNTYGDLPNSDLLVKYGFVDENNENDLILLEASEIHGAVEEKGCCNDLEGRISAIENLLESFCDIVFDISYTGVISEGAFLFTEALICQDHNFEDSMHKFGAFMCEDSDSEHDSIVQGRHCTQSSKEVVSQVLQSKIEAVDSFQQHKPDGMDAMTHERWCLAKKIRKSQRKILHDAKERLGLS